MQTTYTRTAEEVEHARLELARQRQAQRQAQRTMELVEARIALETEGKNAEERRARATLALAADPGYTVALAAWEGSTAAIATLEAAVDRWRDERRGREWDIRLRRVEALERLGLAADDDGAIEE